MVLSAWMEAKNMAAPERRRGLDFRTTARQELGSRVLPRSPTEPALTPESGKRPKIRKKLGTKARIALAGLAVLGAVETTGAIIAEQTNNQPFSTTRTLPADLAWPWDLGKSAVEDLQRVFNNKEVTAPSTFDNTKDKGVIGENNTVKLSQAEIDQQFPTAFEKLGDGKNTLQFEYLLDVATSINPTAQITYEKSFSGSSFEEREKYKDRNIYDTFSFIDVPGGTIIRSPVDGYLTLSVWPPIDPTGADNQGALIDFVAPNGNHYRVAIFGATNFQQEGNPNISTAYVFISLTDAPALKRENNSQVQGTYGIPVKKGQAILQLIQTAGNNLIEKVGFRIGATREGEVGKAIDMGRPSIPTDVELFSTPEGKLITPK